MTPELLAEQGWVVNLAATPTGCCASISHGTARPYLHYFCSNAATIESTFQKCLDVKEEHEKRTA